MTSAVSLFSGGGGLDLGFIENGFKIMWAIDNNRDAVETYKHNIDKNIICADITKIDISAIPEADIIIGGPPCQSFSLIGKRNTTDEVGKLVWRYLEIIKEKKPKAFVFENVTGLLSAKDEDGNKIIDNLIKEFKKLNYTITPQVLNAADYGVPQLRKRVIIVGLLGDSKFDFPKANYNENGDNGLKRYVSVEEAIGDIIECDEEYTTNPKSEYQLKMRANNKAENLKNHIRQKESELDTFIIKNVKEGGNYMDIPPTVNSKRIKRLQKDGGHTTCYGRMDRKKPSYTINTYFNRPNVGCNIHYSQDRLITAREALRIQSFPDNYEVISSSKQGTNTIIGNAVPPLLASSIAKELKKYLGE